VGRTTGITEKQLRDLSRFETSSQFKDDEKLVLRLAVALTQTPSTVSDDLFAALRNRFSELVEITATISWENYRSRFNRTFAIESEVFSKGAFCPLPEQS
jgi:alkylhydroperoxidase family enzyme